MSPEAPDGDEGGEPHSPLAFGTKLKGTIRGSQLGVVAFTAFGALMALGGAGLTVSTSAGWLVMLMGAGLLAAGVWAWRESRAAADAVEQGPISVEVSAEDGTVSIEGPGDLFAREELRGALLLVLGRTLRTPDLLAPTGLVPGSPADVGSLRRCSDEEAEQEARLLQESEIAQVARLRGNVHELIEMNQDLILAIAASPPVAQPFEMEAEETETEA